MSKNLLTLNKTEKRKVVKELLKNGESKRASSQTLVENNDIASAIHLQILSMEEDIKAMILMLDAHGFKIIENVQHINSIFKNHRLRFVTGFILSSLSYFKEDIERLPELARNKRLVKAILSKKTYFLKPVLLHLANRAMQIQDELFLFSEMERIRQMANYVDFVNEIHSPSNLTIDDFELVQKRVLKINSTVLLIDRNLKSNQITADLVETMNSSNVFDVLNHITQWSKKNDVKKLKNFTDDIQSFIEYISDEENVEEMRSEILKRGK